MRTNPELKMIKGQRIEKNILREAFSGQLPKDILWRQKEQFSDGVGYNWIDTLKAYVETQVSDLQLENAKFNFPINTPDSKEAYFYRDLFNNNFPLESAARCVPFGKSVACSTVEALSWDASFQKNTDSSGRASGIHHDAYNVK